MNQYTYKFKSKCPNNKLFVNYKLIINTKQTIMIENIINYIQQNHQCSYHESIADDLINVFPGCHYISAFHHGILIETWRKNE